MAHQVCWTKEILEVFIEDAMLTKDEEFIMRTRVKGWTVTQQAIELQVSESTVHKAIARIKKKYDIVQKNNPILPPRRFSMKEIYMDNH